MKIFSKIVNLKKNKNTLQFSYTLYNVYVMFYYEIPWLYQDVKVKIVFFKSEHSSRSENTGPEEQNTFTTRKAFFMPEQE